MLLALALALSTSGLPPAVELPLGESTTLLNGDAVRVVVEGDAAAARVTESGVLHVSAERLGRATLTVWSSRGRRRTVAVTVVPRPMDQLGGSDRILYRPCPGDPEPVRLTVGTQKVVTLPAKVTRYFVATPETLQAKVIGENQVLLVGQAEGAGEFRALRDGEPPFVVHVEVGRADCLWVCDLCDAAPCGTRLRLYQAGDRFWFAGNYRDAEEWAAWETLARQHHVLVPGPHAALLGKPEALANAAMRRAHLRFRVHVEGAAVVVTGPGGADAGPDARRRAQAVLGPQFETLQRLAAAVAGPPADWSFKLSASLRDRRQEWARTAPDAGPSPAVEVVIGAIHGGPEALEALGVELRKLRWNVFAAHLPLDRLDEVAALGPVTHLYAAGEVAVDGDGGRP